MLSKKGKLILFSFFYMGQEQKRQKSICLQKTFFLEKILWFAATSLCPSKQDKYKTSLNTSEVPVLSFHLGNSNEQRSSLMQNNI